MQLTHMHAHTNTCVHPLYRNLNLHFSARPYAG